MRRMAVDLPAPLWPVRNANSPFATWNDTLWRAAPVLGYDFVTSVNLITSEKIESGEKTERLVKSLRLVRFVRLVR